MYCAGNPVLYKDPSGHAVDTEHLDSESRSALDSYGVDYSYDRKTGSASLDPVNNAKDDIETFVQSASGSFFPFILGNEIHRKIATNYVVMHASEKVSTNTTPITTIAKRFSNGNVSGLNSKQALMRPDIFNHDTGDLYEIKCWRYGTVNTQLQAQGYVDALHIANVKNAKLGSSFDPATKGIVSAFGRKYTYSSPRNGVILYDGRKETVRDFQPALYSMRQPSLDNDPLKIIGAVGVAATILIKAADAMVGVASGMVIVAPNVSIQKNSYYNKETLN